MISSRSRRGTASFTASAIGLAFGPPATPLFGRDVYVKAPSHTAKGGSQVGAVAWFFTILFGPPMPRK